MNLAKGLPDHVTEGLNFEQWLTVVVGHTLAELIVSAIVAVTLLAMIPLGYLAMRLTEKM